MGGEHREDGEEEEGEGGHTLPLARNGSRGRGVLCLSLGYSDLRIIGHVPRFHT
jgi:hypothetical protein